MLRSLLAWFGFGQGAHDDSHDHGHGHHSYDHHGGHGHTHGVVDPSIATTARGIWAIKWSFVFLAITAGLQLAVVIASGSVALLADTIHNVGDAGTAIPLWIAFALARRPASRSFTHGLGRVEDLAGVAIVLIILFSALVAGYEAIDRFLHPSGIEFLGWVAVAGLVGFIGNEAVAVFRIRVGREIDSAALIADGYHARVDGLTSLAVVVGAAGVWLGFPLADPIIGLLITVAILAIVWQSARAVFTRMLDGIEPHIVDEIRHAAGHVPGLGLVRDIKARWLGHRLMVDAVIEVDPVLSLVEANAVANEFEAELVQHLPALGHAAIRPVPAGMSLGEAPAHHDHAPGPVWIRTALAEGLLEIVDTDAGERMRLTVRRHAEHLDASVAISRPGGKMETLKLSADPRDHHCLTSSLAPAEPHSFRGELRLRGDDGEEVVPFEMSEPAEHRHG